VKPRQCPRCGRWVHPALTRPWPLDLAHYRGWMLLSMLQARSRMVCVDCHDFVWACLDTLEVAGAVQPDRP
jgi:hypothetical protein